VALHDDDDGDSWSVVAVAVAVAVCGALLMKEGDADKLGATRWGTGVVDSSFVCFS